MFYPPFCPNPSCTNHYLALEPQRKSEQGPKGSQPCPAPRWFWKKGWFATRSNPRKVRFVCKACRVSFNPSTFDVDYRLRLKISCRDVLSSFITCQGQRQLARLLGIAHTSISRRQSRLAAQALVLNARFFHAARADLECLVTGVKGWAHSRKLPYRVVFLSGKRSQAIWGYGIIAEPHLQAAKGMEKSHHSIVTFQPSSEERLMELVHAYECKKSSSRLWLDQVQNLVSSIQVSRWNDVETRQRSQKISSWFQKYLARQIRKDMASWVRLTSRMAKRPEREMERISVYVAWHNLVKPFRINGACRKKTHAEKAGLSQTWIQREWYEFLHKRAFASRERLLVFHKRIWNREDRWKTDGGNDLLKSARLVGRSPLEISE